MRGRLRHAARGVSSDAACSRGGAVAYRRGWVRFDCSVGGITAGGVAVAGVHPTQALGLAPYQQTSSGSRAGKRLWARSPRFARQRNSWPTWLAYGSAAKRCARRPNAWGPSSKARSAPRWPTLKSTTNRRLSSMRLRQGCWWSKPTKRWCDAGAIGIWTARLWRATGTRSNSEQLAVGETHV